MNPERKEMRLFLNLLIKLDLKSVQKVRNELFPMTGLASMFKEIYSDYNLNHLVYQNIPHLSLIPKKQ